LPDRGHDRGPEPAPQARSDAAIEFQDVWKRLGRKDVLRGLNLEVRRGECMVIIGRSGTGKSVLLKHVVGLLAPDRGHVCVNGMEVEHLPEKELLELRRGMGMLFQGGALFDSMTIGENVGLPLREHTPMPETQIEIVVSEKLALVGLEGSERMRPSSLSGGMKKRAALARSLVLNPKIMLYDEPTTGLDPITCDTIDEEIVKLRDLEEVSSILVTHQLRDAFFVATQEAKAEGGKITFGPAGAEKLEEAEFMMLKDGLILFEGTASELRSSQDPYIQSFLS
jgi:phospholipid/cholesterol/gamma-HCH transport system ATP-binding protein